ncbi:MAG: SDR family oxidoreductase [Armatimonadetes bacterium]|nr:SDR family oxidoreductase [Armatimonadota bacterium]MCA1995910.1 SDR family oxidoreductase [Armatimonadota bacterium]
MSPNDRFLVTGGAGFIGSHIVDALLARGNRVVVLDDLSSGSLDNLAHCRDRVEFVQGSIADADLVARLAEGCRGIFHLAAVVSVPQSVEEPLPVDRVNTHGTLCVLEAARRAGARVVFSSSAAVYGDDPELPKTERSRTEPISPYGVQKLAGEKYLFAYNRLHGVEGVALRYFNVFGPRQNPRSMYSGVITLLTLKALRGEPLTIFGDGSQTRDFVYVRDVVAANLLAMDAADAPGLVVNVGTGRATSVLELAETIRREARSGSEIVFGPPRPGDILHSRSDPSLAERAIGFRAAVPLAQGLREAIDWFRQHVPGA